MAASDEIEFIEHPFITTDSIEYRAYQQELAEIARETHTLICLPTGLGKTAVSLLVTADVLKSVGGKALLLAPTKPLVQQHVEDYRRWLDIPNDEIVVFTGEVKPAERSELWQDATMIIATPQVIENDLIADRISLENLTHCTFDECHRATGNYPYAFIADRVFQAASDPHVTGLSASPGDTTERILTVCENLGIEKVEVRTEDDPSVEPYTHATDVEWKTIELPEEIITIRDTLNEVITDRLSRLQEMGVVSSTDPSLSEKDLRKIRGQLQELIDDGETIGYSGMSIHAEIRKLKTAVSYIETQGVEALTRFFERQRNAARSSGASKASQRFVSDPKVQKAMRLAGSFADIHPKFRHARMLLAETLGIQGGERVIVFTESRDTAETLTDFLGDHFDTRRFVGQNSREGSTGMSQGEQQETLDAFRAGEFEVLVSTSVAEEGLDVPEVDLVLFYEPVPTAIRSIQRKGRTGRQAEGRVVVLLAEDTRDEAYFWISRRREKEMREELRSVKSVREEIEQQLVGDSAESEQENQSEGDGQAGLADFAQVTSSRSTSDEEDELGEGNPREVHPDRESDAVEIVADQRELSSTIGRELSSREDTTVRLESLEIGDYVLSDRVVVERKSVRDFLATLTGEERSIFDQVRRMTEFYSRPILVIEGTENLYEERNVHPNAIRGVFASLAVDFGVSVLWTIDESDTASLLRVIAEREQRNQERQVRVHGEKTTKTLAEQQEYVVSSIAEVGPVTAEALLASLGSVNAVLTADLEELQSVEGVGTVTAERIQEVVMSPYDG